MQNKQMTSLFYLIWLFVIAWTSINFAPFLHFCLMLFAFLLTHSSSLYLILSLSVITLRLAVSLFDFSFLSKSCDVSDGLISLERVDNTSRINDNDAVSNANDQIVAAAADALSFLIVQGDSLTRKSVDN